MMEKSPRTPSSVSKKPNEDLEKSISLLDDILNSKGKNLLRISRTTPQRRSSGFRRQDDSFFTENYDVTPTKSYRVGNVVNDLSLTFMPGEITRKLLDTTGSLLREQTPWRNATDTLFEGFLESMQSHGTEQQVFDTVTDFIQTCSDVLDMLQTMSKKLATKSENLTSHEHWLRDERNTWRLVFCLYQNRISSHLLAPEEDPMDLVTQQSEKEVIQQLYKNDSITRECQLVIDWLEGNASDQNQVDIEIRMEHFTDKTIAWENTLHQLQNRADKIPYGSSRAIVSSLDPDAPIRENKPLHDIDMEDESRLVKDVFVQIRCGRLDKAQSLCVHTGQEWRAAALEGWRLHHDPNYEMSKETAREEKMPIEGNPHRDIWKMMAWQMAENKRMSVYERATFAALCGHLSALMNVCKTWEDLLWAYLKVLVDIRVEKEIRASCACHFADLPEVYWRNEIDLEEIFTELATNKDTCTCTEESNIAHRIQQYLIMDEVGVLMNEMEKWIKQYSESKPQLLRFLAHLVLFFRLIGRAEKEHIGDAVLQAYVKELMKMREPKLVAHYVATLPQEDQVTLYADFLTNITETDERQMALVAAEDADLNIEIITKTVVEIIRNQEVTTELPDLKAELTPEDLKKISALDWVVHYPSQRAEAIWQTNALVRHFLAIGKLEAAQKAFSKVPTDSIDLVMKQFQSLVEDESAARCSIMVQHLPVRVSSSIREYLCYRAYLDAEEAFSHWFEHYHHAKPIAPKLPSGEVQFTERVAFEQRTHQYKSELDRWKLAMQQLTKTVKAQLYNVLIFPEGGWLVDSESDMDDDDSDDEMSRRQKQMEDLRQLCIPKVSLLLHNVMHQMGEYTECIQLADLIVSEQHKLYKVFTKNKLGELLSKISLSSLALLNQKRDPWGHPVSS